MNSWDKTRERSGWGNGIAEWLDGNTANISVVFSWNVQDAYQRAMFCRAQGYNVRVGGVSASLHPKMFTEFETGETNALPHHNPNATFTTRGCIRNCQFCAVPKIEGTFRELDTWDAKPIVCDNNFLASSQRHFDKVIDLLKPLKDVDFNQGLDARLLTSHHAERLSELNYRCIRLAWDNTRTEPQFMKAFETLRRAGIPVGKIHVYILIGFRDTPEDALHRLQTVKDLKAYPNPMRYQPLDSKKRNEYVAPGWSDSELKRYMRYWSNIHLTRPIPFASFRNRGDEPSEVPDNQSPLL